MQKTHREEDYAVQLIEVLLRARDPEESFILEDANMCAICLEKARNVAFMCGHGTCVECATSLEVCPMCRKPIEKKITLFN